MRQQQGGGKARRDLPRWGGRWWERAVLAFLSLLRLGDPTSPGKGRLWGPRGGPVRLAHPWASRVLTAGPLRHAWSCGRCRGPASWMSWAARHPRAITFPFAPWEPSRSPSSSSALPCPRAPWVQPARQKKGGHVFLPSAPGPWAPSPQLLPGRPLSGSPSPWTFLPSPRGPCGGFSELLSLSPQLRPHLRQRPVLYVSASHAPCLRMRGSEDQSRRVLRWPRPQPSPHPLALLSPAEPTGGSYTCFTSK